MTIMMFVLAGCFALLGIAAFLVVAAVIPWVGICTMWLGIAIWFVGPTVSRFLTSWPTARGLAAACLRLTMVTAAALLIAGLGIKSPILGFSLTGIAVWVLAIRSICGKPGTWEINQALPENERHAL